MAEGMTKRLVLVDLNAVYDFWPNGVFILACMGWAFMG